METQVERIRRLCAEKGVRVSVMERDLGYGNGFLNPKKIKTVPAQRLVEIAGYLNVSVQYLATGETQDGDEVSLLLQRLRDEERALLEVTRDMTPEQVRSMTEFARRMKGV